METDSSIISFRNWKVKDIEVIVVPITLKHPNIQEFERPNQNVKQIFKVIYYNLIHSADRRQEREYLFSRKDNFTKEEKTKTKLKDPSFPSTK